MASPLQDALEGLVRPLEFAARDDFAHVLRIKGLVATLADAGRRVRGLAHPPDLDGLLDAVEEVLEECDDAAGDVPGGDVAQREKLTSCVERALKILAPVSSPGWVAGLLDRSPACLSGVGPKRAALLAKRRISTIADLLFHFPVRYDDRRSLVRVGDLQVGAHATFVAEVKSTRSSRAAARVVR